MVYDILVNRRGLSLENFVKLMSYNACEILCLGDRGCIKEGRLGDIVIWSEEEFTASIKYLAEGTDYTPYENKLLLGKAERVVSI